MKNNVNAILQPLFNFDSTVSSRSVRLLIKGH